LNEAPHFTSKSVINLAENNKAAASVVQAKAVDADTKQTPKQTLTYAFVVGGVTVSDSGPFHIDSATGKITIPNAGALNYEDTQSYTLTVRATDNGTDHLGSGSQHADQTLTVNVLDLNEAPVVTLLDASQHPATGISVAENSATGTVVGYVKVVDPD